MHFHMGICKLTHANIQPENVSALYQRPKKRRTYSDFCVHVKIYYDRFIFFPSLSKIFRLQLGSVRLAGAPL